jgi:hypothetical protein
MATYFTSPSINYYRINENNTAIAQTNLGNGTPTEEIAPPLLGGTFSSYSSSTKIVTGESGATFLGFEPNMYLYYTESSTGEYKLAGQIASITDNTHLVLTSETLVNSTWAVGNKLYAGYSLITTNESIYIRIQTVGQPVAPNGKRYIPNFGLNSWRIGNGLTGLNNSTQSYIDQVSSVGSPLTNAPSVTKIAFTFVTMNQFAVATTLPTTRYWANSQLLPLYVWIRVTPSVGSSTSLSSQTLYRFVTQEYMQALEVGAQTTGAFLQDGGYNNVSTGSVTGGEQPQGGN